ncbi:uncharacterized protein LOC115034595, partial [Acyrthosiphon pisum]|uniref:Uncharacterized protein n=1 Tax=Acyrthosiphon pisum TaxID=7029 RepID=A0A8R2JW76_ACYPI
MKHSIVVEIKGKMLIITFGLILFFSSSQSDSLFRPNLPVGEYLIVYDKLYPCEKTKNYPLQFNWYLSKKTSNVTEVKGNTTFLIPFDDTLTIDFNLASWGSTGGWVPNAYIVKTKKACSNAKSIFGNSWLKFIEGFNIPTDKCPLPV